MHRWGFAVIALAFSLAPFQSASAQTIGNNQVCRQMMFQNVLPIINQANRFNPGGVFPVGFAPLAQPFATNPNEFSIYNYPWDAYYKGYYNPPYANSTSPWLGSITNFPPPAQPGAVGTAGGPVYGPTTGSGMGYSPTAPAPAPTPLSMDLNPDLSSAAIYNQLRSSGSWDRLTATEQADWLFRLAQLQNQEFQQRIQQTQLNQQAEVTYQNTRRVPFDLSVAYQERARGWRDSYSLYAQTVLSFISNACDPTSGIAPITPTINNPVSQCIGPGIPFAFCTGIGR
jgi:hypothetical protein